VTLIGIPFNRLPPKKSVRPQLAVCAIKPSAPGISDKSPTGRNTMRRAIALARELNDTHALAVALFHAAFLSHFERHPTEVERLAADLLELATRRNFALWLTAGEVLLGWARGVSGSTAEGLSRIENGIRGYRAAGSMLNISWALALKAECLHLAVRTHCPPQPQAIFGCSQLSRHQRGQIVKSSATGH
jgi:hypothetical protein